MYPDQDQKPTQDPYPVNYLEEIAPQNTKKSSINKSMRVILLLLGITVFITIALMIFSSLTAKPDTSEQLAARLKETATITANAQKTLKSSQLRTINSSLTLFLANTNHDLAEHMKANGLNASRISKTISATEKADAEELVARLEDARLNATYDRTYAREMAFLLETTATYMQSAYEKTNNSDYQTFLDTAYDNLVPMQEQLAKFNDSIE